MSKTIPVTILLSEALIAALPDLARVWKASDEDDIFTSVPEQPPTGILQRMAEERYDEMVDPKFSREIGVSMIASNLLDEAKNVIVAKTCEAALTPKPDLKALITAAQEASAQYLNEARIDETHEPVLWDERQAARRALNDAIYETLGVNINELRELTQT